MKWDKELEAFLVRSKVDWLHADEGLKSRNRSGLLKKNGNTLSGSNWRFADEPRFAKTVRI